MAYDEALADRVRQVLGRHKELTEKKMFGGITFMLRGNMCCGVTKEDLVVRVGAEQYEKVLVEPHARPMDFTGRSLKGLLYVGPGGYESDEALGKWVERGVLFALSLQAK